MPYLLDTNAVIALLKNHPTVVANVRRVGSSELRLCAPVEAELWFGVWRSGKPEDNRQRLLTLLSWLPSLPFSSSAAPHFGEIRAGPGASGNTHRPLRSANCRNSSRPRFGRGHA